MKFDQLEFDGVFQNKKILVTGHTGFKGSWLTKTLSMFGANVYGFSNRLPSDSRHAYYELSIGNIICNPDSAIGDVREGVFSEYLIAEQFDFVYHLAAQAIVSTAIQQPEETFTTNTLGTLKIMNLLKQKRINSTCIIITSDKCYFNDERDYPYSESDLFGGDDPYSASKACAEIIFNSYLSTYEWIGQDFGIASTRAGNVFGGGDWSENRLIPDCARAFSKSESVTIRMPEATRPWTSVHDVLRGYLLLGQKLKLTPWQFRGSWNFASGESRTVEEVVRIFNKAFGEGEVIIDTSSTIGVESKLLQIDPSKARNELHWATKYNLEDSLLHAAAWYKAQSNSKDMGAYSESFLIEFYSK
jgi:CDP-glucose 4,6-dehydratase